MLQTTIPTKLIGSFKINGTYVNSNEKIYVPLSTFETPLWYSVSRGAKVSENTTDGISCIIVNNVMTRSILMEANSLLLANKFIHEILPIEIENIKTIAESTSKHLNFKSISSKLIGRNIFLRIEIFPSEASGHNMVTIASDKVLLYLAEKYHDIVRYVSVSGNLCTDKKSSAINSISGRGKYVIASLIIPEEITNKILKTSNEKIHNLNIKKNLIGSIAAGSIMSANAHFANMLLAFYLAFGQDAANIVEGSEGLTTTELLPNGDLEFSVTLPNLILGTIGNGKHLDFARENIRTIGCINDDFSAKENGSLRMAEICAATVLSGELSLMAALTNEGALTKSHIRIERINKH